MTKKIKIKNNRGLNLSSILSIPDKSSKYPAIILLHGFTGYKDEKHIVGLAMDLVENGFVSIRFDCSGFGESDGNTKYDYRVSNYVDDIESIYEFLKKQDCVDNTRIGVWGQSMGGMLSIIFTSKHPEIKAVCAVSAPTKITRAAALEGWLKEWKEKGYFDKWSSKYGQVKIPYAFVEDAQNWSAEESVKNIHVPLLIILGKEDDTVYPANTRTVFEAANEPKKLIEVDNMNHDYKKHENLIRIVNSKVIEFFNKQVCFSQAQNNNL